MSVLKSNINRKKTFLSYELSPRQDAIVNYLIPSVTAFLLYIFLFASDISVIFRHFKDDNPIWAFVTLFIMFFPSLISYIVIISSWELWPDMEGCERDNCIWFMIKTTEHLLFPIWAMWRFAETVFWSIEAVRSTDETAKKQVTAPRTIELYFFLQAFLHSLPQMLLQLNILMRQDYKIDKQTADAEVLSFVFNLTKLASTVAFYQRFKSQKLAGRQYPWFKSYKKQFGQTTDEIDGLNNYEIVEKRPLSQNVIESKLSKSRRNSDFYLEPEIRTYSGIHRETLPINESTRQVFTDVSVPEPSVSRRSSDFYLEPEIRAESVVLRETSVIDGPKRQVFTDISEPDFNIKRVVPVKGLPDDDLAGKLVSFFWWSCFMLARILAISTFFYFYPTATIWILVSHFIVVISFLVYDVKLDDVKRSKTLFFIFVGLIYIFCIIEFKIRFKKTKFMYSAYFIFVFLQNFIMCIVWWVKNVEDLQNDFWFRYIFYIIIAGSFISFFSMMLYMNIYKPKKIIVGQKVII